MKIRQSCQKIKYNNLYKFKDTPQEPKIIIQTQILQMNADNYIFSDNDFAINFDHLLKCKKSNKVELKIEII
jgi:hypothetical protein